MTAAAAKHTPTPWYSDILDDRFDYAIVVRGHGQDENVIPIVERELGFNDDVDERSKANIDLIVRAVNAHDDMLALLRWLDRKGGLGLDVHERISAAISKAEAV